MKTPTELIAELQSILFDFEDDDLAVKEYGHMFAALSSSEVLEARAGMHRVSLLIVDHGKNLHDAHDRMRAIVRQLANP